MKKKILIIATIALTLCTINVNDTALAKASDSEEQIYYYDKTHKIEEDEGFSLSEKEKIEEDDAHFGWKLGRLYVKGYTQRTESKKGKPIFLKNAGDKLELGFELMQDINALNNDETLSIANDKKAYDLDFGIKKTKFGKGALIVRHTDYQNKDKGSKLYVDYFLKKSNVNANKTVKLNEEGEYEVALDYTLRNDPRKVFGISIFPTHDDYTIRTFKFSVRNGNSMGFIFDISTGDELKNKAFVEKGFKLDFAHSHYLKVYVARAVVNGDKDIDVRERKPAKSGNEYTDEGLYIITIENPSTKQITSKQIYVGKDKKMRAYVTTGKSLKEIEGDVQRGAKIKQNGELVYSDTKKEKLEQNNSEAGRKQFSVEGVIMLAAVIAIIAAVMLLFIKRKSKRG